MEPLDELRSLELRLLDPAVRRRPGEVARLLHPDFVEFGASGHVWDRDAIVAALAADPGVARQVSDLVAELLAPGVALVTYRVDGTSLRSSVWVRDAAGWRVRFHQGTPAG